MLKIVIVDDSPLMRKALSLIFQAFGVIVLFQARDFSELKEYLFQDAVIPDVIFLDIDISTADFTQSFKYLNEHFPFTRIVAVSLFNHEKLIIDVLRNGAMGYLSKHTEPEELLRAAQTVMNGEIYLSPEVVEKWKIPTGYLTASNRKKCKTILLNDREYEFLSYCARDMGYKEIAEEMGVQYKTIDSYRASVTEKLQIHTRSGLAAYAIKYGLDRKIKPDYRKEA